MVLMSWRLEEGCRGASLEVLLLWYPFDGEGEILTHPLSAERRGSVSPED